MTTIKIKSTHEASQGPFVIIDIADFKRDVHEPYDDASIRALNAAFEGGSLTPTMAELLAARDALKAREAEIEKRERELAALKPADGAVDYSAMTKDELHSALKEKGRDFPANANKAELIELLSA